MAAKKKTPTNEELHFEDMVNSYEDMIKNPRMLNLSCPIFVYYVNVKGLSPTRSKEMISEMSRTMSYDNATCWFVPITEGQTRIELLYNPISSYSPFE